MSESDKKQRQRRQFWINIFWGILIFLLMNFVVPQTEWGQVVMNAMYAYLVREDFRQTALKHTDVPPISDRIRIVAFDEEDSRRHNGDFWTPRELLGKSILRALEIGARVLVVDIAPYTPVPVCKGKDDENSKFLDLLRQACEKAKEKRAVILFPWLEPRISEDAPQYSPSYKKELYEIMKHDAIRFGCVGAYEETFDNRVRHFQFYEKDEKGEIIFSLQILAIAYPWHGRGEGNNIIRQKADQILSGADAVAVQTERDTSRRIYVYPQDEKTPRLEGRYLFRLAPRKVTQEICGNSVEDLLVAFPDLVVSPDRLLLDEELNYTNKVVLIGSVNPEMGDVHLPPLGKMNGVFLVANSIKGILQK